MTIVISAEQAAYLINDGDIIATGGFVGAGVPEELLIALENRFIETKTPTNLTSLSCAGTGDLKDKGLNHLAHEGLIDHVIAGHIGLAPKIGDMVRDNKIKCHLLPQGVLSCMYRDAAAHRPRHISKVGLHTFVDPRIESGRMNKVTEEDLVELTEIDGEEYLSYKPIRPDVALLRGTYADEMGSISLLREALSLETLDIAAATHNNGGIVIMQVENIRESALLSAKDIDIPGNIVDFIVIAERENHRQTFGSWHDARIGFNNEAKQLTATEKYMTQQAEKYIKKGNVCNIGIGRYSELVVDGLKSSGMIDDVTLTTEAGAIGGMPESGLDFGVSNQPDTVINQPDMFNLYDGGLLDVAVLGAGQVDRYGNVCVHKFGDKLPGPGGFINITQSAKTVIFMCPLTTSYGQPKFLWHMPHITYNGPEGRKRGQNVYYVTDLCVFKVGIGGTLGIIDVREGVDVEKDIQPKVEFFRATETNESQR